jgi:hypothetical protein
MNRNYEIKESSIHGKGVFATKDLNKGDKIGLAIAFVFGIWPFITNYLGSWVNHCGCDKSNLELLWDESDESYNNEGMGWYLVANKDIKKGSELLINYANTPFYIEGPQDYYTC